MIKFIMRVRAGIFILLGVLEGKIIFLINFIFFWGGALTFIYFGGGFRRSVSGVFSLRDYSFFLILLRMWIIGLIILSLLGEIRVRKLKMMIVVIVLLILIMFFCSMNLLVFYFFFEVRLIPTFFIVYY